MTLQVYWWISLIVLGMFSELIPETLSAVLHEDCLRSSECQVDFSHCDEHLNKCVCRPQYTIEHNTTTCLPGTLLGFECKTDGQCALKVSKSGCVAGVCTCSDGFVAYRRHTCLPPSNFGEICFNNEQCNLAISGSECTEIIPKIFGRCQCGSGMKLDNSGRKCQPKGIKVGQPCKIEGDCAVANAYCQRKLDGSRTCTCEIAFSPSADLSRCLPTYRGLLSATSLGYPCHANLQCQLADPNSICSGGICDCSKIHNSTTCNAKKTGCHRDTFQCHGDGTCVSWYFVCDGQSHCSDGSDEICTVAEQCPKQAFQCKTSEEKVGNSTQRNNIKCISRSKLCNGVQDCEEGEDELGCSGKESTCPPGTFQCTSTKECLPEHHFCNSVLDCKDFSDENEKECRLEFQPADFCPFRCDNGLCRSSAIVCSGVNGCGDFSDEKACSVCRCPRGTET